MVDSHCHLEFPDYKNDFAEVLQRAQQALDFVINVGTTIGASAKAVALAQQHDFIYASVGIHPDEAHEATPEGLARLRELARQNKVVAIGECGLDYFRLQPNDVIARQKQREVFTAHLQIARDNNLPIIIHCREAYDDVLNILRDWRGTIGDQLKTSGQELGTSGQLRGVMHCYLGNIEQAHAFLNLGFYISFTGIITFKNASEELLGVVREMPLAKMLIETDSPFLTPVPHRGKRNEPSYVVEVARKIAELKNVSVEEVDKITTQNARELFGVK